MDWSIAFAIFGIGMTFGASIIVLAVVLPYVRRKRL